MITKFISRAEDECEIQFLIIEDMLKIEIEHFNPYCPQEKHEVELSKEDLFELIGQLLRIQSKLKKEIK